jgi:hypothetical protein
MLKRTAIRAVLATILILLVANAAGFSASKFVDWRALFLVTVYLAPFVLARYTPGVCLYRLVVLDEPDRHYWPELERARVFAVYARRRMLLAGLVFTLLEIARIAASYSHASGSSDALSAPLLAAIYAMGLYFFAGRAARAVTAPARR